MRAAEEAHACRANTDRLWPQEMRAGLLRPNKEKEIYCILQETTPLPTHKGLGREEQPLPRDLSLEVHPATPPPPLEVTTEAYLKPGPSVNPS